PVLGGHGLGRLNGMAVFVEGSLPGQRVQARITALKPRHAWAEPLEILEQSPDFTPPGCPHFGLCGGCDWLHMRYDQQLFWKRELVGETLRHLGQAEVEVAATIPSPITDGYRNKMEFAFAPPAADAAGQASTAPFVLGLRPCGQAMRAVAVDSCRLCPTEMIHVRQVVEQWAVNSGLAAYDPETGQGFWRHLVLRTGHPSAGMLAVLITAPHARASSIGQKLAEHMQAHAPQVYSLVHATRKSRTLFAQGERTVFTLGAGRTTHHLDSLKLVVSSQSFFQSNTPAAKEIYAVARDFAALSDRETLWDLYSGVGGIALSLAGQAGRVLGLENVPSAVRDAKANARRNKLAQCRFVAGDAVEIMDQLEHEDTTKFDPARPDVIVADPPRGGMSPKVIAKLLSIKAPKLILVSCNPATQARDIKLLSPEYTVNRVQPVDMFPHTSHIECVAELVA
ncbi:MAG TPA: 23S rRNA (uracil(1939)-C(5))-methyltransferase RlmD, partial [Desulfonatronum sp.]|nr:23S rRNA (uracil(1939)-C(5))-methyltransferase RlmD [Desulfonatronum sp.]